MQTIRRLYLYLMSGISLGVLVAGLIGLLGLLFSELGLRFDDPFLTGESAVAERISLSAALTGVALPVWLVHWWLAERGVAGRDAAAEAERRSDVRALYLSAVLLLTLIIGALSALDLVRNLMDAVFSGENEQTFGLSQPADSLAWLLVMAGAWGYHVSVRLRDMRVAALEGPAVALPRLYLYIAATIGVLILLIGTDNLLQALVQAVLAAPALAGPGLSSRLLMDGVAGVLVGGIIWAGHWLYATRIAGRDDWRGHSERASRLRTAYLVVVLLGAAASVVGLVATGMGAVFRAAMGLAPTDGSDGTEIVGSLAAAVPFAVAAWLHHGWLRSESHAFGGASRALSGERLSGYLLAGIGLFVTASGVTWLVGILLDMALGGARTLTGSREVWRGEVSQAAAVLLAGAPLWLWFWYRAQLRRSSGDGGAGGADEAASAMRRIYLFGVLGGALIAVIVSIAVLLYRGFSLALESAAPGSATSDVSGALGGFLVATALIAYHAVLLRRDVALKRATDSQEQARAGASGDSPQSPASVSVVITGPPGTDADGVVATMTARLPAGYTLRRTEPEPPA